MYRAAASSPQGYSSRNVPGESVLTIRVHGTHRAAPAHPPPPPQALGDSEQGFSEDDYIGLFDEVKFPTSSPPRDMPNADSAPAAPADPAAPAASSEKTRDAAPSEKDGLTLG